MVNNLRLVTVATHETHELERFISSAKHFGYQYDILGLGKEWVGGEANNGRLVFPGGGMKVNLLKDYLSTLESDNDVILFTDSYDVVFNDTPEELLNRWESMGGGIIFTAEKTCWPDPKLSKVYPESPYDYRFLNSGGFIATVGDLKKLTMSKCEDSDDDQLYYTLKFLNSEGIKLDYNVDIFQTLNSSFDDVVVDEGVVYNKVTGTNPIVIHANGGVGPRTFLNSMYNDMIQPKQVLKELTGNESVLLQVFFHGPHSHPKVIMDSIEYLSYPKNLIDVVVYNTDKLNQWSIDNFVKDNEGKYNTITTFFDDEASVYDIRQHSFGLSKQYMGDYVLQLDGGFNIKNKDTIQLLIGENKDIIAPMINTEQSLLSNFWGGVENDYYLETEDYFKIRSYEKTGTFVVPFIKGVVLFTKEIIDSESFDFSNVYGDVDTDYYHDDHDVVLASRLREGNLFMNVTNKRYFGKTLN